MRPDVSFTKIGGEIDVCTFGLFSAFSEITHFVTTRGDYHSGKHFSTFNLGRHSGEDLARVLSRRDRLCEALGITADRLIQPRQVHGAEVVAITPDYATWSQEQRERYLATADGVVTDMPGVCIAVSTADCVPILCYDTVRRVIAASHAGWRGTVGHIAARTVQLMCDRYGTAPGDVYAAVGPSIGVEAFEVGDEVAEAFSSAYPSPHEKNAIIQPRNCDTGKYHVDLWAANVCDLQSVGILPEHITVAGICTYTRNELFYSSRRAAGTPFGRFLSGIMLNIDKRF